jgi:hypothetical protein
MGVECRLKVPCWFCVRWTGEKADRYFVAKVAGGLIEEPVEEVLSEKEIEWTMGGRLHGDGRRSDQYVDEDRRK